MRTFKEIKNTVLKVAAEDNRIRAVLLNGSRANPAIMEDRFQDYDLVFLVTDIESYTTNPAWASVFGDPWLSQLPDKMETLGPISNKAERFAYLLLFKDGIRIDLTLVSVDTFYLVNKPDSLTIVWMDKDQRLLHLPPPSDQDYRIKQPSEKEFLEACNEFWWVSTNVAKGLARHQIIYAKQMMEGYMRPMFMKVVGWHIGLHHSFCVSIGNGGKFIDRYIDKKTYKKIRATYAGTRLKDNWNSLHIMTRLFNLLAKELGAALYFSYDRTEAAHAKAYLKKLYKGA